MNTTSVPGDYFTRMYDGSPDPWGFRTRWYERRKRDLTLAALTRPSYRRAFEPGCSIGMLTRLLGQRCSRLVASDVDPRALTAAAAAVADQEHVTVERLRVPDEWPDGAFDLVVVSELGYYLSGAELHRLFDRVADSLEPGGTLLLCHWRHPVADYPRLGDSVHANALAHGGLVPAVHVQDQDFVLDLLTNGTDASPARREGLLDGGGDG